MNKITTLITSFVFLFSTASAQMWNGVDTLYGNEWIEYDQSHFKIMVAEDGLYRINYQTLVDQGIPMSILQGNQLRMFYMGEEQSIFTSTNNSFGNNDYIEFFGKRNRGDLDEYLFPNPQLEMANPEYSLFSDSSAYFLTWNDLPSTTRFDNISNDLGSAPATPEPYCFYTIAEIKNESFSKKRFPGSVYHSEFGMSEGFVGAGTTNQTVTLSPEALLSTGPNSQLSTRTAVLNHSDQNSTHDQTVSFNGNVLAQDQFSNAKVLQHDFEIVTNTLGASVAVDFAGLFNGNDRQQVAFVKLTYPRSFDFGGKDFIEFSMLASSSVQYLSVSNFDVGNMNPVLYDLTNQIRIETSVSAGQIEIALPPSTTERKLVLVNTSSGIKTVNSLNEISFIDYTQQDDDFIIISNKKLFNNTQSGGTNWVEEYANYRSSPDGRNYNTTVVDVNQLYDQFAYGVNRHSISIRNFGHFIKKEWSNPKYIFIIGKGRTYEEIRTVDGLNESILDNTFHVPTFGTRGGGDNLLMSTNVTGYPIIPIGRVAAKTPDDVRLYLEKVIAQESNQNQPGQTIEDRAWRKRILHLGGGNTQEQPLFKSYLGGFESIIENSKFGAEVTSYYKTTSDPVQISISDQLTNFINEGISVLTLFGHASLAGFDFSIDDAESYDNEGRFPVMVSLGCFSGQIHTKFKGVSEDFILTEKKGAIVFFASTGVSFSNTLRTFGNEFYRQLGDTQYGMGIGDVSKAALKNADNSIGYLSGIMTLHGDPSIRVKVGDGPDYVINSNSVKFEPNPISVQLDSFDMSFEVVNLGQRSNNKMLVEVLQELPNGEPFYLVSDSIQAPFFKKTISYRVPTLGSRALGANKISIEIDKGNSIVELPDPIAEENNKLLNSTGSEGVIVQFVSNEIIPVYPKEFSIVDAPNLTLKASTSSPFLDDQKYIFEIDTTENFDSPFLEKTEITQKGGVVKWTPTINYQNDQVYYWRVSPEEDPTIGGFIWRKSSFVYLDGAGNGWNQSHYFQFLEDDYFNMNLKEDRNFQYITDFKDIRIENQVIEAPYDFPPRYFINNNFGSWWTGSLYSGLAAGMGIAVIDTVNVVPWVNDPSLYGTVNYWPSNLKIFPFKTNETSDREKIINFLQNAIPNGYYVIVMTFQEVGFSYDPEEWAADDAILGTNIFDVLEAEGATQIQDLETLGSLPYILVYKKGEGVIDEIRAANIEDAIVSQLGIPGNWDQGNITSSLIGPARSWESMQWKTSSLDNIPTDIFSMDVIGVDINGNDSLLIEQTTATDTTLSQINAEEFPYLKLRFNSKDTIQKSTVQLDYWRVFYEGIPEVALNPSAHFTFQKDTLQQGEKLEMSVAIENIGRYDMDSLLVNFSMTDQGNNQTNIFKRLKPLQVGDTLIARLDYDTYNFANRNTFQVLANPSNDQAEETLINNIGFFDFFVETDRRNPLLDVTFDGVHIMNGDLVSSRPHIQVSLKDENQFLALDNPELVKVFLQSPNDPEVRQIFVDGDTLIFLPGNSDNSNKAQIAYSPELFVDGTYYLIIQAQDQTGNQSGDLDYKISFEVKNKSAVTKVLNYPNPFSTSTRFVFTLTGSELPEDMKIQIMTVSGRIVREILQEELGPLHIGNNLTYAWDGTDEYGAKLANGVYLYRVVIKKSNNESFEELNTKADQFFKNNFGKLVIIR